MWSIHHRGTVDRPGLVLALEQHMNSSCKGVIFQVSPKNWSQVLLYLRERELVSSAYEETEVKINLPSLKRSIKAITFVIKKDHDQYCQLTLDEQARVIAQAEGGRGRNDEYLFNTEEKLRELGIISSDMRYLVQQVRKNKS
jgi:cation transport protein ChaC